MNDEFTELRRELSDRYELLEELGHGGMGTVFRARDLKHSRVVALKVLRLSGGADHVIDRFEREIAIVAGLSHPHIVPLHDSGTAGGLLFYVMPVVEGESLRIRIPREGALPVDEAVRIACQVADALQHAHSLGVVHRDVKPENILLSKGHALLTEKPDAGRSPNR